jgi:hypothetical protein
MLVSETFSAANLFDVIVQNGFAQCSAVGDGGG